VDSSGVLTWILYSGSCNPTSWYVHKSDVEGGPCTLRQANAWSWQCHHYCWIWSLNQQPSTSQTPHSSWLTSFCCDPEQEKGF
jgi:hypothetical protein